MRIELGKIFFLCIPSHLPSQFGIISETDVLSRIVGGRASMESTVAEAMIREVETVHLDDDATRLTKVFADGFIGIVVDDNNKLHGVVTQLDLVDFLTTHVE